MPYLEHEGNTREVTAGQTMVGSGPQATWRVQNADIAARHFTLTTGENGEVQIKPHSAQHVVVVNGQQVPLDGVALKDGDVVTAGTTSMRYLLDASKPRKAMAAPMSDKAYLINETEQVGYHLSRKKIGIGRDSASHIMLRDASVSRFHADVRSEAGQFVLYPMGSAGTKVNGETTSSPMVLQEGDKIQIGAETLHFTRQALPAGVKVGAFPETADDETSRRETMIGAAVVTGESETIGAKSKLPIIIGVVVVVIVAVYFLFMR